MQSLDLIRHGRFFVFFTLYFTNFKLNHPHLDRFQVTQHCAVKQIKNSPTELISFKCDTLTQWDRLNSLSTTVLNMTSVNHWLCYYYYLGCASPSLRPRSCEMIWSNTTHVMKYSFARSLKHEIPKSSKNIHLNCESC